jgi:putative transposase
MSRLRRVELHSRFFFVTTNLRRGIRPFSDSEFGILGSAIEVVRSRTKLALCAYCFMPDHWHAIVLPAEGSSISDILMRAKILAQRQISKARLSRDGIWQSRFYDRILRSRREFDETLEYIHQNPVRKGLVKRVPPIGPGRAQDGTRTEQGRLRLMKFGYRSILGIESEEQPQVPAHGVCPCAT